MKGKLEKKQWLGFILVVGLIILVMEYYFPTEGAYASIVAVKMLVYVLVAIMYITIIAVVRALENLFLSQSNVEEKQAYFKKKEAKQAKWKSWGAFQQSLTNAKPIAQEHEIEMHHDYDGIKELDNNLPPWWVYGFYMTIVFAIIYMVKYEVLGGQNQQEEYLREVAVAQKEIAIYKAAQEPVDLSNIEVSGAAGKKLFKKNCAVCHGVKGEGMIGPNLTDVYWLLGGGIENVYKTINKGGRPGKGMVAWGKSLSPDKIQQLAAYIISLQGTEPENAKAPQGDKWEEVIE